MSRRLTILAAALLGSAATLVAQGTSPTTPQRPDQDEPAPFRVAVDVVRRGRPGHRSRRPAGSGSRSGKIHGDHQRPTTAGRVGRAHRQRCRRWREIDHLERRVRGGARSSHRPRRRLHQLRRDRVARRHPVGPPIPQAAVAGRLRRTFCLPERRQAQSDQGPCRRPSGARYGRRTARPRRNQPVPRATVGDRRHHARDAQGRRPHGRRDRGAGSAANRVDPFCRRG